MITILAFLIVLLCIATWRHGGPLRALLIAWLVCITPVAIGIVRYDYLVYATSYYVWLLGASIVAFAGGVLLTRWFLPATDKGYVPGAYDWDTDFAKWLPFARACMIVAAIANTAILITFITVSSLNLDDLRSDVVTATSVDLPQRIATITVWACFACLAFGLYFRHRLTRVEFGLYMLMSVGIFLSSLASAGRQSVAQIILFTILLEAVRSRRMPRRASLAGQWAVRGLLVGLAAAVVIFVTINRSAIETPRAKADLFLIYFNAELSDWFENLIAPFGQGVRDFLTEVILYLSSSVPLFSIFSQIDFGRHFYGVFDFPFLMRQVEPFTGISVIDSWNIRTQYLGSEQVIGTGWTTAPSHLMLDVGVVGMVIFLVLQGAASEWTWNRVRRGGSFGTTMLCVILTIAAIYMPFLPALSDTNLFLLAIAVAVMLAMNRAAKRRAVGFGARPLAH
jgi:oligosaccharide repeat unit polymerase